MSENNGWINCANELPEPFSTDLEYRNATNKHLIYFT